MTDPAAAVLLLLSFLFALCFHEFAHAWMAKRYGDNTAEMMGRLTLNPVPHADIVGTVVLPILAASGFLGGFFLAWAKPVPVNPNNLTDYKNGMFWVAAAGPLSNLLLAVLGFFALILSFQFNQLVPNVAFKFLPIFMQVNLFLCFFNLIPIHPLDGGKILARFLPENINRKLEEMQHYSMILLVVLLLTGVLGYLLYPANFLHFYMIKLAESFIP